MPEFIGKFASGRPGSGYPAESQHLSVKDLDSQSKVKTKTQTKTRKRNLTHCFVLGEDIGTKILGLVLIFMVVPEVLQRLVLDQSEAVLSPCGG
jgi:hypothetical protein